MDNDAIIEITRAFVSQARFSGLLLSIMVEKGILTNPQAHALIEDVKGSLPAGNSFHAIYDEMLPQFR